MSGHGHAHMFKWKQFPTTEPEAGLMTLINDVTGIA